LHRILNDKTKRTKLINDVALFILKEGYTGINIDFEELVEEDDAVLINFQKELYEVFHRNKLLVSQDVIPFNEDYNYSALSKYNDYIFL
ncbi:hypothetical protein ABTM80_19045, partial [Acinetobacter baumannii]